MTATLHNASPLRAWSGERSEEGHRTFNVTWLVRTTSVNDGPFTVMKTPGLAQIGSIWAFGNDVDPWAFCTPYIKVERHKSIKEGWPGRFWIVSQKFSSKPPDAKRCQDSSIEDPLLEPQKISGSFVKYQEEVTRDKDNNAIRTSSFEQIRGSQVEFDKNRPTVRIEQNRASLGLATFTEMVDTVNNAPLWGVPARTVKLSNVSWERNVFGTCNFYYTRTLEFDVNFNTFDNVALDEGNRVLKGHWNEDGEWQLDPINGADPSASNPSHFIQYKDANGENSTAVLNGSGLPAGATIRDVTGTGTGTSSAGDPGTISIQYYQESNFLLLGIPTSLE